MSPLPAARQCDCDAYTLHRSLDCFVQGLCPSHEIRCECWDPTVPGQARVFSWRCPSSSLTLGGVPPALPCVQCSPARGPQPAEGSGRQESCRLLATTQTSVVGGRGTVHFSAHPCLPSGQLWGPHTWRFDVSGAAQIVFGGHVPATEENCSLKQHRKRGQGLLFHYFRVSGNSPALSARQRARAWQSSMSDN